MGTTQYIVTRDGETLATFDREQDAFGWLLRHVPYSVSHATEHEGYSIETVAADPRARLATLHAKRFSEMSEDEKGEMLQLERSLKRSSSDTDAVDVS